MTLWQADGSTRRESAGISLPAIPSAPDRDDILSSGLWNASQTEEKKTKRSLEERYVDGALSVVRMCHGGRHSPKTPEQIRHLGRSMGPWKVMIGCNLFHRALASGLAALSRQATVEIRSGVWEHAPDCVQDVLKQSLEMCTVHIL